MDGEDPHRVVVGLGCDRLDRPGPLVGLLLHPLDEAAQAGRRRRRPTRGPGRGGSGCGASGRAGGAGASASSSRWRSRTTRLDRLAHACATTAAPGVARSAASPATTGWSGGSDVGRGRGGSPSDPPACDELDELGVAAPERRASAARRRPRSRRSGRRSRRGSRRGRGPPRSRTPATGSRSAPGRRRVRARPRARGARCATGSGARCRGSAARRTSPVTGSRTGPALALDPAHEWRRPRPPRAGGPRRPGCPSSESPNTTTDAPRRVPASGSRCGVEVHVRGLDPGLDSVEQRVEHVVHEVEHAGDRAEVLRRAYCGSRPEPCSRRSWYTPRSARRNR